MVLEERVDSLCIGVAVSTAGGPPVFRIAPCRPLRKIDGRNLSRYYSLSNIPHCAITAMAVQWLTGMVATTLSSYSASPAPTSF